VGDVLFEFNGGVHEVIADVYVKIGISIHVHTSAAFLRVTQDDGSEVGNESLIDSNMEVRYVYSTLSRPTGRRDSQESFKFNWRVLGNQDCL
jgi:hypothetical protein